MCLLLGINEIVDVEQVGPPILGAVLALLVQKGPHWTSCKMKQQSRQANHDQTIGRGESRKIISLKKLIGK